LNLGVGMWANNNGEHRRVVVCFHEVPTIRSKAFRRKVNDWAYPFKTVVNTLSAMPRIAQRLQFGPLIDF
jgi:hypothetical protein